MKGGVYRMLTDKGLPATGQPGDKGNGKTAG